MEPDVQLCAALRYFAQGGFLPVIGDMHGISDRAASQCIHSVSNAICENIENFIAWPNDMDAARTKQTFYDKTGGFPRIVGLIDGTQVPINGPHPPANEPAYVNRKGIHALNCQIVCDAQKKIISLDARWPGSTHDAFILRNSEVYDIFESGRMGNGLLLGDSGYGLSTWLLTPYLNPANDAQIHYNNIHKRTRCAVERCIGILKMRWRCLTKPIMFRPERASRIVASCAALHNFAVSHRLQLEEPIDEHVVHQYEVQEPPANRIDARIRVREDIVELLYRRHRQN